MIAPHGGRLVNRVVTGPARERWLAKAPSLPRLELNARETDDVDMIACGAMSPLEGFLTKADYDSVLDHKRLAAGLPWTIPVVLSVKGNAAEYQEGQDVALYAGEQLLAVLHVESKFPVDKAREAKAVLLTDDPAHPGVQYLQAIGDWYLGGKITTLNRLHFRDFQNYRLDPIDTRVLFDKKGWRSVVAFQTRNPIHRAHEYLTKCALETCDGLLIHPLVGDTKGDDIPAVTRVKCYEALMEGYYPRDRVVMAVYPQAMRYAGPREAILHALVRKNYGVTHFIVGRDHAGVGSYYGTYDAQNIFYEFEPGELGITPMMFEHSFFCKKNVGMASSKTSNSTKEERVFLSGTQVRAMLNEGIIPPPEFTRPEVAKILIEAMRARVST